MRIYYQDELYGKIIANSIARHIKFCLNKESVKKPKEIICKKNTKIIDDLEDKWVLLLFTYGNPNYIYWARLVNNIISDTKGKGYCVNIIDLTLWEDFPITVSSGKILSICKVGEKDWLEELTENFLNLQSPSSIEFRRESKIIKNLCIFIKHKVFECNEFESIEHFIKDYSFSELKDYLIERIKEL